MVYLRLFVQANTDDHDDSQEHKDSNYSCRDNGHQRASVDLFILSHGLFIRTDHLNDLLDDNGLTGLLGLVSVRSALGGALLRGGLLVARR